MADVVVIGEGMLELSRAKADWRLGTGGDTLNTAVHLARAGHDVAYLTALGTDPYSDDLKGLWAAERIDTSLILTHPERLPGLYAIRTDDKGERSFAYWRERSAAREMFALPAMADALARAANARLIVHSLITLAILPPEGRAALLEFCAAHRARGGLVAFDGNYRPRLWADAGTARAARDAAIAQADIGLPTLEDEHMLGAVGDAGDVSRYWRGLGCAETIVKLGAEGCLLPDGQRVAPPIVLQPVDTSGAGDAFNGGYLSARLNGADQKDAALAGHRLAGWVVMRPGAIPADDEKRPGEDIRT